MTPLKHSGLLSQQKPFTWILLSFLIAGSYFTSLRAQNTTYKDFNGNASQGTTDMGYPKGTGQSIINTNTGFHQHMIPLKEHKIKPVNLSVSNQSQDSLLKNEMMMLSPMQAGQLQKQDLKVVADSILREGLDLYRLVKVSGMNAWKGMNGESMSYLDKDSIRTIFCQPEEKDYRVNEISTCAKNEQGTIRRHPADRLANANEKRLMDIRKEIRGLILDSPNLNGNTKLIQFDIAVLDKNNMLYFYLLPRSLEPHLPVFARTATYFHRSAAWELTARRVA